MSSLALGFLQGLHKIRFVVGTQAGEIDVKSPLTAITHFDHALATDPLSATPSAEYAL